VTDAAGLAPLIRRALRRRGIGWSVKVREVPCLYRCPLDGVTVRAGGLPGVFGSGETRILRDGHDKGKSATWAVNACEHALQALDDAAS
jgi:hypothetical protein